MFELWLLLLLFIMLLLMPPPEPDLPRPRLLFLPSLLSKEDDDG